MLNRHPMAIVDIFQSRKIITGKKFKIDGEERNMECNFTHNVYLYTELQNVINLFREIQIYFKLMEHSLAPAALLRRFSSFQSTSILSWFQMLRSHSYCSRQISCWHLLIAEA